jgi:cyclopropane fatty-acyl-phospholipid synthase-like methyltransferase
MNEDAAFGLGLAPGDLHYRAYVGPPERYDLIAAMQFNILTHFGLREHHRVLDIGCGSLRLGRLAIPYLRPGNYYGIEPHQWLIDEGIERECGRDLIDIKQPHFSNDSDFTLSVFGVTFDFLIAQSIFTHAAASQITRCLREAAACMHPQSKFLATYAQGESDYDGDGWLYPDCCTYRESTLVGMAESHGLSCTPVDWRHPHAVSWVLLQIR